jgi:hypothetical protein
MLGQIIGSLICACSIAALTAVSYRRLSELRHLQAWAAPYLRRAPGTAALPGELSEATRELGWQLRQPAFVPRACGKAAFSLGALAALLQAAAAQAAGQPGSPDARAWIAPLVSLSTGCAGALGCAAIGRAAELLAERLRGDWNALIRRSTRDVAK